MSVQNKMLALLIFSTAIITFLGCGDSVGKKVAALQEDLARHLPVSSGYADVLAYLDRNGIQHSVYSEAQSPEELRLLGAPGRVDAVVRKVKRTLVSTTDVRITFLFDEHGRMLSYNVFPSVKAP